MLKSLLPLGLELLVIVVNELVEEAFFGFSPSVLDESSGVEPPAGGMRGKGVRAPVGSVKEGDGWWECCCCCWLHNSFFGSASRKVAGTEGASLVPQGPTPRGVAKHGSFYIRLATNSRFKSNTVLPCLVDGKQLLSE